MLFVLFLLCTILRANDRMQDIDRCHMLNAHLITLAHDYPYAKFLIISAQDLDFAQDSGDVVLPTLLVYQDGELIANLVAIDTAWGRELEYSVDEVKRVLIEWVPLSFHFLSFSHAITDTRYWNYDLANSLHFPHESNKTKRTTSDCTFIYLYHHLYLFGMYTLHQESSVLV